MNQRPPHLPGSLDAEERALAKALPRLHGRTMPGPDLDASILAAAQAAVQPDKPARAPSRPGVRWITPTALAASMVLAAGMAWHLRPLPVPVPASAPGSNEADGSRAAAAKMIEPERDAEVEPVAPPTIAPEPTAAAVPSDLPVRERAIESAEVVPDAMPAPVSSPAPAPAPALVLPPPPAPPPPAPARMAGALDASAPASSQSSTLATQSSLQVTQDSEGAVRQRANARAAGASAESFSRNAPPAQDKAEMADAAKPASLKSARPAAVAPLLRNEAEMAADGGFVDAPGEDIPPATAASPAVRDAWLHRIGELLEQGKRQEATASLAEFRRRYPNAVLPPALRALEIEP